MLSRLGALEIETPSWGYGNSGTRFHVYPWPGAARTVWERIDDAALVHRLTGCCPSVALHIPWDRVDDWSDLARVRARSGASGSAQSTRTSSGRRLPARKPLPIPTRPFGAGRSTTASSASRSRRGSARRIVSLWLADGTNYPGQDDLRSRSRRLARRARGALRSSVAGRMRLLVEYKFFEPAFYSTDLPDWGTAALVCRRLGPQAQVLVDTGHHPQGTNIEQIVALLAGRGAARRLPLQQPQVRRRRPDRRRRSTRSSCSGSCARSPLADPARGGRRAFMIDQSHNVEGKIDAMIQSVMNIQTAYAKALSSTTPSSRRRRQKGTCSARIARSPKRSKRTCGRCSPGGERTRDSTPTRSGTFRDGGHAEHRARERGSAPVESAYEKL